MATDIVIPAFSARDVATVDRERDPGYETGPWRT
jgi:hypothetical protein